MDDKIVGIRFLDSCPRTSEWFVEFLRKYNKNVVVTKGNQASVIMWGPFTRHYSTLGLTSHTLRFPSGPRSVYYTGENTRPQRRAHANLTFDHTSLYNNIRLPLWITYGYDKDLTLKSKKTDKFCCFVYSNEVRFRNDFCQDLARYKHIACGGRCLNNVGGRVQDKIEFQRAYKFCIACENSCHPGYCTEKILEAYKSNCIPIYLGSSTVHMDFNPETFINANDFKSSSELIQYIKRVDSDENLYNSYMNKPIFSKYWLDIFNDPEQKYFKRIYRAIVG